jgi:hypothetical protein
MFRSLDVAAVSFSCTSDREHSRNASPRIRIGLPAVLLAAALPPEAPVAASAPPVLLFVCHST